MHRDTLSHLACPSCRCAYKIDIKTVRGDNITTALLDCPGCGITVPVIAGFPLFEEARPWGRTVDEHWVSGIRGKLIDIDGEYQQLLEEKAARGTTDLYAAFQPFNESTRALYAFLPLLEKALRPGDIILDTWCRTGWSGELLAGLFPQQRILSIWEGNSNVLGYKGFAHWLKVGKRLPNLDIMFTHADHALPLADNSVRVVHGLDSLHRYRHSSFIPECLRVCDDEGLLIFPHIHLSNSQPEPFFERGCHQYHGKEWKAWLDKILLNKPRCAWVLPEAKLFETTLPFILTDQSDTTDYNAVMLIADGVNEGRELAPGIHLPPGPNCRFVCNPLVSIKLHQCEVWFDDANLAGLASIMMERHPCYAQHLKDVIGECLEADEARFIWHAQQALELQSIADAMQLSMGAAVKLANTLCNRELLHAAPVSQAMHKLQHYFTDLTLPQDKPENFADVWDIATSSYARRAVLRWLEDDSVISIEEATYLVDAIRSQLIADGFSQGARLLIACDHHPEALLLCWAAWLQGMVTAIIDPSLSTEKVEEIRIRCDAKIIFTDNPALMCDKSEGVILFDGREARGQHLFSDWLEPAFEADNQLPEFEPEAGSDADAAILFTSGTTGLAKGVVLSQRALCRSGLNMAQTHGWHEETLLSLGSLSMMSGLRNPAVAALASASTILVPGRVTTLLPLNAWSQTRASGATIITAVPAWLSGLMSIQDRLEHAPNLRQILVTGTTLSDSLYREIRDKLGIPIGNYYGLTETGGICSATLKDDDAVTLGYPANALLLILDDKGKPVKPGESGLLRVYSDQLMSRYLGDPKATATVLHNGWLLTGDRAHRDQEGRLLLDGRDDELLKLRNGMRFHPQELEAALTALQSVESAAVVIQEEQQTLVAMIVSAEEPDKIRKQLLGTIADHLLPERIFNVTALPLSNNGKLLRSKLPGMIREL